VNPDDKEFRVIFGSDFLGDIDFEAIATSGQRTLQFLYIVWVEPVANDSDVELIRLGLFWHSVNCTAEGVFVSD
jgi:hypothetical protein